MRYTADTLIVIEGVTWIDNEGTDRRRKVRRREDREKIARKILEDALAWFATRGKDSPREVRTTVIPKFWNSLFRPALFRPKSHEFNVSLVPKTPWHLSKLALFCLCFSIALHKQNEWGSFGWEAPPVSFADVFKDCPAVKSIKGVAVIHAASGEASEPGLARQSLA
jgi:hypothetical protein